MDEDEEEIEVPITNDLERRIADTFEVFDHAGNKTVDVREIATIVRALGCCPTEAEIQEIVMKVENPEVPGTIHLLNFLPFMNNLLLERKYQPASPEELLEAFQVLDSERRGYLTKEHISTLMTQGGEPFTQDELDEMLEIAIDPHTQTIPYEFYINQLMNEPPGEKDTFKLVDRMWIENPPPPPPPPPKRFSQFMEEMNFQG